MEHLFFSPSHALLESEASRIVKSGSLDCDWSTVQRLTEEITWEQFRLVDVAHKERPDGAGWTSFSEYPTIRGFNFSGSIDGSGLDGSMLESATLECVPVEEDSSDESMTGDESSEAALSEREEPNQELAEKTPWASGSFLRVLQEQDEHFDYNIIRVSVLQSWITFGLLEAVFQKPISLNYLAQKSHSVISYFDSRNLTFALYAELQQAQGLTYQEKLDLLSRVESTIDICDKVILSIVEEHDELQKENPDFTSDNYSGLLELIREGIIVSSLFREALKHTYQIIEHQVDEKIKISETPAPSIDFIVGSARNELATAGLCPHFIHYSLDSSLTLMFWLAWWATSTGILKAENHHDCDSEHCALDSMPDMQCQHGSNCRQIDCRLMAPNLVEVCEALESDHIPLLRLQLVGDKITIETMKYAKGDLGNANFVAFSHVWRHGFGSTTEKGLFQCQLRYLWKALSMLSKARKDEQTHQSTTSPLFWIDSLAVPSSGIHRKLAIQNMNLVYSSAESVLVIDKALSAIHLRKHNERSAYAAIAICAWQTRLWTLLEAQLAQKVRILLSDSIYTARHHEERRGLPSFNPQHVDVLQSQLFYLYLPFSTSALSTVASSCSSNQIDTELSEAARASFMISLRKRSTTKASDESLVLATAFGLDTKPISESKGEDKMCAFYIAMREIPTWWIFQGLPRISKSPFTWGPKSFLSKRNRGKFVVEPQGTGRVTLKGLQIKLPLIVFGTSHNLLTGTKSWLGELHTGTAEQSFWCVVDSALDTHDPLLLPDDHNGTPQFDIMILDQDIQLESPSWVACGLLAQRVDPDRFPDTGELLTCRILQTVLISNSEPNESFTSEWDGTFKGVTDLCIA